MIGGWPITPAEKALYKAVCNVSLAEPDTSYARAVRFFTVFAIMVTHSWAGCRYKARRRSRYCRPAR